MKQFHKIMALTARVCLGAVFVFSGFVKAVDPLGTAYKIQDYLEAFGWSFLYEYALIASFALFCFEMVVGCLLLVGTWRQLIEKATCLFLLAMTGLTLVLALTNPISDCGCFGEAIVLTNWQTFEKNVVLLILSLLLRLYQGKLYCVGGQRGSGTLFAVALLLPLLLGLTSYRNLPLIDFRPYKVGSYLPDKMNVPEGATTELIETTYLYEKDGKVERFSLDNCPFEDSTWHYVDREERVLRKGVRPAIEHFELLHPQWGDVTEKVLNDTGYVFLVVMQKVEQADRKGVESIQIIRDYAKRYHYPIYGLSSSWQEAVDEWRYEYDLEFDFCSVDDITLKTMIRANPGVVLLKAGTVCRKWCWRDIQRIKGKLEAPLEQVLAKDFKQINQLVIFTNFIDCI